jgi:hypothetical protein
MADTPPTSPGQISICVLALDGNTGSLLLASVVGREGVCELELDGKPTRLDLHTFDPAREQEMGAVINLADAAVLLVQHLDAPALELLKGAYRILPSEHRLPVAVLIVREASRAEFKMACPNCSQKLWVRDEDQGRVGRCPHCKKTFVLPAQDALIKQLLALPASMPVTLIALGNPVGCRGPLSALAERARLRAQVIKSSTVPVQIDPHHHPGG